MSDIGLLLDRAHEYAKAYTEAVGHMPVFPGADSLRRLHELDEPLPQRPGDPEKMLRQLHELGSVATVAQTAGRYFGFVNGGAHPPAVAARWMADVWDQNAALYVMSPLISRLETICESWLVELLRLPEDTAAGIVGGTTTSLLCGVATARDRLLAARGWDVNARGLFGAPEVRVVLGRQAHAAVLRALSLAGLGTERVELVDVDDQGRMIAERLPELDARTLVIAQAGNVNSGAFDPIGEICRRAHEVGAWVHVDGAFGLWAGASDTTYPLFEGTERADSWSADAHKTLNVPYDCGIILCREREALVSTLQTTASYLQWSEERDGMSYAPDMSRRGRAVDLWATLKTLGRTGVAELVDRLCSHARLFAARIEKKGFRVLNDVVFNQVLVACESPERTRAVLDAVQRSGECWCGGAEWRGEPVIRVSVCSWATTEADIERAVNAFEA